MKKKYIKPTIIIIETCNDDCNMVGASLYDIDQHDSIANIANEGDEPLKSDDKWGTIWND